MKRFMLSTTIAVVALGALLLSGCASKDMSSDKVWGYVAAPDRAALEVSASQVGTGDLLVKRVLAPQDSWIVVHADDNGAPGMRVGLKHVKRGETINVSVPMKGLTTPKVIVALHADRGTKSKFDFDMMKKEMSLDRPFFVNGKELARMVTVRDFGVKVDAGTASLVASPQVDATSSIVIGSVQAPGPSWVVVHLDKDGAPGDRVGLVAVPAGASQNVAVTLAPVPLGSKLLVALHADRGTQGLYEFDMMNKLNSPDQPYFVGGKEVAIAVPVK